MSLSAVCDVNSNLDHFEATEIPWQSISRPGFQTANNQSESVTSQGLSIWRFTSKLFRVSDFNMIYVKSFHNLCKLSIYFCVCAGGGGGGGGRRLLSIRSFHSFLAEFIMSECCAKGGDCEKKTSDLIFQKQNWLVSHVTIVRLDSTRVRL